MKIKNKSNKKVDLTRVQFKELQHIKNDYDLDRVFGLYNEMMKNENLLSLKNFSIDFILQTNSTFEEFNECIKTFKSTFFKRGMFKLNSDEYVKIIKKGSLSIPTIEKVTSHNLLFAYFSSNEEKNEWFKEAIEERLLKRIPILLIEGFIIAYTEGEYKVIFDMSFIARVNRRS